MDASRLLLVHPYNPFATTFIEGLRERIPRLDVAHVSAPPTALQMMEEGEFQTILCFSQESISEFIAFVGRALKRRPDSKFILAVEQDTPELDHLRSTIDIQTVVAGRDGPAMAAERVAASLETLGLVRTQQRIVRQIRSNARDIRTIAARQREILAGPPRPRTTRQGRLLFVDEGRSRHEILRHLVMQCPGLEFETAATVEEARKRLSRYKAPEDALVLLNLMLPKGTSFPLLRHIRKSPGLRGLPVIGLVAYTGSALLAPAYRAGITSCVIMPDDADGFGTLFKGLAAFWFNHHLRPS